MTTATTASLAAIDRWTDARLAAHVRRTLHDDRAWLWDGYTNAGQVARLRKALCALNGTLLDAAAVARRGMTPAAFEVWARANRAERAAVDRRLAQVARLRRIPPEAALPKAGEPLDFAKAVAKMARAGMVDREIGAVFKASARHIARTRKLTGTLPGRFHRRSARQRASRVWGLASNTR